MLLPLLLSVALAQDEITYEGGNSATAANYVRGKPVTITHASGNLQVRCMETEKLSARLQYTVFGTQEGPMESMGKGIGLAVWGDSTKGGVSVRVPSKPSGVSRADVQLTVNIPAPTTAVTVTQTGDGWVQVVGCDGVVKVSAGKGGAYVSGHLKGATVTASGGDVKVLQEEDAVFTAPTTVSAPAGSAVVQVAPAQGGKVTVKAEEVSVAQTVMGTNLPNLVQGDLGLAGPTITVTGKTRAELSPNR